MTYAELVFQVALFADMPKTKASRAVKAVLEVIVDTVKSGEKVTLKNFGTFYPYDTKRKVLFGGSRLSEPRRKIRFTQSRRMR